MKNILVVISLVSLFVVAGCGGDEAMREASRGRGQGSPKPAAGLITAAEWNDLGSWIFWENLLVNSNYRSYPSYWGIYTNNRVSVRVKNGSGDAVQDIPVSLVRNGGVLFTGRTNNYGVAELWVDAFQMNQDPDFSLLSIDINNGEAILDVVKPFSEGINDVTVAESSPLKNIDIAFVVDATGSMGDELNYLKKELVDVIARIKSSNSQSTVSTASVFYRDESDEYLTRVSAFTEDTKSTIDFIKKQSASGGGDYPEAVHTALIKTINELQWSSSAQARILFLVLDAPPHYRDDVLEEIHIEIAKASALGIRIIPVSASGINKETEFLLRFMSIVTNGTYIFITDDSGIGNHHIEPSVGEYQVEKLNDLMVRLVNEFAK